MNHHTLSWQEEFDKKFKPSEGFKYDPMTESLNHFTDEIKEFINFRFLPKEEVIRMVESLEKPKSYWSHPWWRDDEIAYNQALNDLLSKLKQ